MKIIITRDYQEMSERASGLVLDLVKAKPDAVLGLATGNTPLGLYRALATAYAQGKASFAKVKTFNLDDYVGLPRASRDSFWHYMQDNFFSQVDIKPEHIYLLDGTAKNLADEAANYERQILDEGGIDLQILGIGMDGHIGFCEPGASFTSRTGVVNLTRSTREVNAQNLLEIKEVPAQGITMGLGTIMEAQKIILLANGRHKAFILHHALYGPVTEAVPASLLQRHPDCTVIIDAPAAGE